MYHNLAMIQEVKFVIQFLGFLLLKLYNKQDELKYLVTDDPNEVARNTK